MQLGKLETLDNGFISQDGLEERGRGKRKWIEVVEKYMKVIGLKKADVQGLGRRKIRGANV